MMKTLTLILFLAATVFSQTDLQAKAKEIKAKDISIKYDKYKDKTFVSTKPYNLIGGMEGGAAIVFGGNKAAIVLTVEARSIFQGQKLDKTPEKVYLVFASQSKGWMYLKGDRNLYVLYDESRMELKPVMQDSDVVTGLADVNVVESLGYEITVSDLQKLASAKDVSIELGGKPRKFKSELLERFQKFVKLVTIL